MWKKLHCGLKGRNPELARGKRVCYASHDRAPLNRNPRLVHHMIAHNCGQLEYSVNIPQRAGKTGVRIANAGQPSAGTAPEGNRRWVMCPEISHRKGILGID